LISHFNNWAGTHQQLMPLHVMKEVLN